MFTFKTVQRAAQHVLGQTNGFVPLPSQSLFTNLVQVRHSTKKAAGSKTHMKDSAGRRLGPKRHEGQLVKTGEILIRQRGTKFYPGENCSIGKDHTIFATEPGFVRYYLDPFHPKRKFVGVALTQDLRLPTDHWAPRVRRFGYVELEDPEDKARELEHLPRKDWKLKLETEKELNERQIKREQRQKELLNQYTQLFGEAAASGEFLEQRLALLDKFVLNGCSLSEAETSATFTQLNDLKIALRSGKLSQDAYETSVAKCKEVISALDKTVALNWKRDVIKKMSEEEVAVMKASSLEQLKELTKAENLPLSKESLAKVTELIFESPVFSKSEVVRMKRRFLKPVASEKVAVLDKLTKKVKASYRRYNYESGKIETIHRSKEAFLGKK